MHSYVKFYAKDNELHKINFQVQLGGLKGPNAPGENLNTSHFDENKDVTIRHEVNSISKISQSYNNI